MIALLSGTLVEKSINQCIVDVRGVGYRIIIPLTTFYELPEIGQPLVIQIHTHVREDAVHLYGFSSREERAVFQLMISVSGIGPRLAINVLSGIAAGELIQAVMKEDLTRLTGIPGVGKKTAERMILEMKDKAAKFGREIVPVGTVTVKTGDQVSDDAFSALVNLGYKGSAVKEVIDRIMRECKETPSLDRLLKQALKTLAG